MSTRCNIKITSFGRPPIYLYRHWDGYPAVTGASIVEILREFDSPHQQLGMDNPMDPFDLANRFLAKLSEPSEFRAAKPHYELTEMPHGDISYLYEIQLRDGGEVRIGVTGNNKKGITDPADEAEVKYYTVPEFVEIINQDIDAINGRIADRKAENPKAYAHMEPMASFA